tara:strand:+ start:2874 stop:6425 length:3552 start_codon:yes stop_codon:yes gene_type:complete
MAKSYRIKAETNSDKHIQVTLEQDFDQLEILSLKIVKSDVYARMCADYGVIVGRAVANGGFGIPNAKISIFVPLTEEDELDPVISELYPYKTVTDKNEEGYRYNLLPKYSESCNHKATGSFFTAKEAINNPIILEVFEKYYKYTTKTNESGDYMLWGVPLGNQNIHASIDVSDIGCYSMRPYQFIRQGLSPSQFESSLDFKTSENLDTLPQIVIQNKAVEVVPFWGDDELCGIGITRMDFDLRDSGVEIIPSATFMGSVITDNDNNYVSIDGMPTKKQGSMCDLSTGTGTIEAIRHTIIKDNEGCPTLENFTLDNGGKVIDGNGAWVTQLPMNLDFLVTNEYGEQIISSDPKVGIPTRARYRFRVTLDASGGEVRSGRYLVPNLREYNDNIDASYTFSENFEDYPDPAPVLNSPAYQASDYFYEFRPNRVYTVSSFIDNYRLNVRKGSTLTTANSRWRFLGIKSINPSPDSPCPNNPFPVNDAFRGGSLSFATQQINRVVQLITILLGAFAGGVSLLMMVYQYVNYCNDSSAEMTQAIASIAVVANPFDASIAASLFAGTLSTWIPTLIMCILLLIFLYFPLAYSIIHSFYVVRRIFNYPNCEPCFCGSSYEFKLDPILGIFVSDEQKVQETLADAPEYVNNCNNEPYMVGFGPRDNNGEEVQNALFWRGDPNREGHPKGCYVLQWRKSVWTTFIIAMSAITVASAIPYGGSSILLGVALGGGLTLLGFIISSIYHMYRSLNQWRILANIYSGLCEGIFNMKFSNNWINGVLYHYKFLKKRKKLDSKGNLIPEIDQVTRYPKRIVYEKIEDEKKYYYYRSCPFTGDEFTMQSSLTADGSGNGKQEKYGINFPTTIMDLGPLDPCIDEICQEEKLYDKDNCYVVDRLKPTSFQNSENLLGMIVERKIAATNNFKEFLWSGINKWFGADAEPDSPFNRNQGNQRFGSPGDGTSTGFPGYYRNRVIDGDIAQLLATNNMMGVSVFSTDPEDPYYGASDGTMTEWFSRYMPDQFVNNNNFQTPILWDLSEYPGETKITTATTPFPLITRDFPLTVCLMGGGFGVPHTQVVPYYPWTVAGNTFGTYSNDYGYQGLPGVEVIGYQQGLYYEKPEPNVPDTWISPYFYEGQTTPPGFGYFANSITGQTGGLEPSSTYRLGTGLFFYFGLRPGGSAYEKFINEYLPPKDDE